MASSSMAALLLLLVISLPPNDGLMPLRAAAPLSSSSSSSQRRAGTELAMAIYSKFGGRRNALPPTQPSSSSSSTTATARVDNKNSAQLPSFIMSKEKNGRKKPASASATVQEEEGRTTKFAPGFRAVSPKKNGPRRANGQATTKSSNAAHQEAETLQDRIVRVKSGSMTEEEKAQFLDASLKAIEASEQARRRYLEKHPELLAPPRKRPAAATTEETVQSIYSVQKRVMSSVREDLLSKSGLDSQTKKREYVDMVMDPNRFNRFRNKKTREEKLDEPMASVEPVETNDESSVPMEPAAERMLLDDASVDTETAFACVDEESIADLTEEEDDDDEEESIALLIDEEADEEQPDEDSDAAAAASPLDQVLSELASLVDSTTASGPAPSFPDDLAARLEAAAMAETAAKNELVPESDDEQDAGIVPNLAARRKQAQERARMEKRAQLQREVERLKEERQAKGDKVVDLDGDLQDEEDDDDSKLDFWTRKVKAERDTRTAREKAEARRTLLKNKQLGMTTSSADESTNSSPFGLADLWRSKRSAPTADKNDIDVASKTSMKVYSDYKRITDLPKTSGGDSTFLEQQARKKAELDRCRDEQLEKLKSFNSPLPSPTRQGNGAAFVGGRNPAAPAPSPSEATPLPRRGTQQRQPARKAAPRQQNGASSVIAVPPPAASGPIRMQLPLGSSDEKEDGVDVKANQGMSIAEALKRTTRGDIDQEERSKKWGIDMSKLFKDN